MHSATRYTCLRGELALTLLLLGYMLLLLLTAGGNALLCFAILRRRLYKEVVHGCVLNLAVAAIIQVPGKQLLGVKFGELNRLNRLKRALMKPEVLSK